MDVIAGKAAAAGLVGRVTAAQGDVRQGLPVSDGSFDACYSHMLFRMAFTAAELELLAQEIRRAVIAKSEAESWLAQFGSPE